MVGSDIKLTCNHRDHDYVYWEWKSPSDDEFKPINKDSERGASFQNRQTASLIIKSKTKTIGNGGYRCRYYNTGDGSTEKNRRMSNVLWIGKIMCVYAYVYMCVCVKKVRESGVFLETKLYVTLPIKRRKEI